MLATVLKGALAEQQSILIQKGVNTMLGFAVWSIVGVVIIALGIRDLFAQKPVGFWANVDTIKVNDVKGYNRATGILFMVYGSIFILLGIPLLDGQNSPFIILSIVGVMFETIVIMAVYSIGIVKKYGVDHKKS